MRRFVACLHSEPATSTLSVASTAFIGDRPGLKYRLRICANPKDFAMSLASFGFGGRARLSHFHSFVLTDIPTGHSAALHAITASVFLAPSRL
jgi:hypothetical protein